MKLDKNQYLKTLENTIKENIKQHKKIKDLYFNQINIVNSYQHKNLEFQKENNKLFGLNKELKAIENEINLNMLLFEKELKF